MASTDTLVQITTHLAAASLLLRDLENQVFASVRIKGHPNWRGHLGAYVSGAAALNWTALDLMRRVYRERASLLVQLGPERDQGVVEVLALDTERI